MTAQPLFQFGTVTLHPTPDRRVIRLQTALGEQLFDIAQRERVAKIPAHRTKNQLRRRLPPLEDCRSGYVIHGLSGYQPTPPKLQHIHTNTWPDNGSWRRTSCTCALSRSNDRRRSVAPRATKTRTDAGSVSMSSAGSGAPAAAWRYRLPPARVPDARCSGRSPAPLVSLEPFPVWAPR